ncbi:MAG: 50S ribosomal protein L18 [Nannocystis sp.]|jgi:large subunit ribosomal protein L18|nr:50S ribosomal protein L18 [Nannocystis sp.]
MSTYKDSARLRRKKGIRVKVIGSPERPRLTVFRSCKHIYAQVIDDTAAVSLAAASDLVKAEASDKVNKRERARLVGLAIAKACIAKGITKVVFDRNGYIYHGRVSALADGAREGGLDL